MATTRRRSRAESHADADFGGLAGDGEGGDAVEADGGEQQSERAEELVRRAIMRSSVKRSAICSIEGLELHNGEVGVDGGQRLAGDGFHVGHGVRGLDDDGAGVEGDVLVDGTVVAG